MGLIKEPLNVDFVVDSRPLTQAEERAISDFIRADKEERKERERKEDQPTKQKSKQPA